MLLFMSYKTIFDVVYDYAARFATPEGKDLAGAKLALRALNIVRSPETHSRFLEVITSYRTVYGYNDIELVNLSPNGRVGPLFDCLDVIIEEGEVDRETLMKALKEIKYLEKGPNSKHVKDLEAKLDSYLRKKDSPETHDYRPLDKSLVADLAKETEYTRATVRKKLDELRVMGKYGIKCEEGTIMVSKDQMPAIIAELKEQRKQAKKASHEWNNQVCSPEALIASRRKSS